MTDHSECRSAVCQLRQHEICKGWTWHNALSDRHECRCSCHSTAVGHPLINRQRALPNDPSRP